MKQKDTLLSRFTQSVTTLFLTGIILLLPITLTVGVLSFLFRVLVRWLEPLKRITNTSVVFGIVPHPEIILAVLIILIAGIIYNVFLIRTIIHALENLVIQIPIIRPVYSGFKQLVRAFSLQDKLTFKQVVLVEFPRKDVLSIGFLTSEFDTTLADGKAILGKKLYNVFIPTTPNPTTGFFVIVPEEQIIKINVTRQEAMAMIISGGIIQPEHKEKNVTEHHHA